MCGSSEDISGIIVGLAAAAAILLMAFADRHAGAGHVPTSAHASAIYSIKVDIERAGARPIINQRF
jgi:hypothetical protein